MSDKKTIIICSLIFLLFFLLFPLNLSNNISYKPNQSANLVGNYQFEDPFKLKFLYKDRAGYFNPDLSGVWSTQVIDGITLLNNSYINLDRSKENIDILGFDNELKFSFKDNGYPFSIGNRLLIIGRNRKEISEVVGETKVWTREFNHIITSVDSSDSKIVIGFVEGNFKVLDNNGFTFFDYQPAGSRVSIVYSVAISNDDGYIGVISGLDPQRFTLYELNNDEYKPYFNYELTKQQRKTLNIVISDDNKFAFIENRDGYFIVDIQNQSVQFVKDEYQLKCVEFIEELDLYVIHTASTNYNKIKVVTKTNREVLNKKFKGDNVSVKTYNNSIYVVIDNSVIKLDMLE